jgi:TonB-dependent SusC/RagA subfamily outer membrane receptor
VRPVIFVVAFIAVFSTDLVAQPSILDRRVKLEHSTGTVAEVLKEISEKGCFYFSYGDDILDNKYVRLSKTRQTVREFLDEIFSGEWYRIEYGNKLMLKQKLANPEVYTVKGRVVERDSRLPIPGATVIIPGTDPLIGTVTGEDGSFSINIPLGMDVIRFSCIGFESRTLSAGRRSNAEISLDTKKQEITGIEIIKYTTPVIPEVNAAVSYIPSDILHRIPAASIDQVLQGNASGVHVVNNSGMPGASLQVNIRGRLSLIRSDPVYYLNGIRIQSSSLQAFSPHDIGSIEVLKDASSSSLYGSSAANGVVLLDSKKGEDKELAISFYHHTGLQQVRKTLDLLNTEEFLEYFQKVRPEDDLFEGMDTRFSDENQMEKIFHTAGVTDTHLISTWVPAISVSQRLLRI